MIDEKIKEELEKNKKVVIISKIEYKGKNYIKTIKNTRKKIGYIYYEIQDDKILEVQDEQLLSYFKEIYECKPSNIIY